MSYSFGVRAASVALAAAAIAGELDKVSETQPIHQRDREAADSAISNALALVAEPGEFHELNCNIAGSCYGPEGEPFHGISLSINISRIGKTG